MKFLVCVKQVPGTTQVEVDPETGVLKRDGVESKLNPYDLFALEQALSMVGAKDRLHTVSMGPPQAKAALLETVYMGAEGGTLISDRRLAGADVLSTAYTLYQGIKTLGSFDVILCGKQTTDGDTAQVGAELAEFLGIPHATGVQSVEVVEKGLRVKSKQENKIVTMLMPLPCLLCMDGEVNTPRLPSYKRKKMLTEEVVNTISLEDLDDADPSHYGLASSPTQVERIFSPEKKVEKTTLTGSGEELGVQLAAILQGHKFI